MAFACKILADSINTDGDRLTSFEVTYPRIILAEVNTHRMLSRNTASSRAIPVAKMIAAVQYDPFIPVRWGKNKPGMGSDEVLPDKEAAECRSIWLQARDEAIASVDLMCERGLVKEITNRLLEPWMWTTSIISATEWGNFFGLRCHPKAQPEFQVLAKMMWAAYAASTPVLMKDGEWHLPYLPDRGHLVGLPLYRGQLKKISAGRCARTSYTTQDVAREPADDILLAENLVEAGHMSPLEHPAMAAPGLQNVETSNFRGWRQYRKFIEHEDDFSKREAK